MMNGSEAADQRFDYVAVGPKGVYALCEDIPGRPETRSFIADVLKAGHHIERVTVEEACRRHREYLRDHVPGFRALMGHAGAQPENAGPLQREHSSQ